jgi:MFS family permease
VFDGCVLVVLAYSPSVWLAIAMHSILATTIGTLAPAFGAMISLVSPPRCRSAAFSTISVFAIPGIAVFLPLIGTISDSLGIQASMLTLVPVSVAAGFLLSSASRFIEDDIEAVRAESLARVASAPIS